MNLMGFSIFPTKAKTAGSDQLPLEKKQGPLYNIRTMFYLKATKQGALGLWFGGSLGRVFSYSAQVFSSETSSDCPLLCPHYRFLRSYHLI